MLGLGPGEVFVHRNIANLVISCDMSMLSVLQYAVQVLQVEHIIICGHYECGGVKASMMKQDLGLIDNWLRNIRDVQRLHAEELEAIEDFDAKFRRLVELNVIEQVLQLYKTGIVQSQRTKTLHEGGRALPRIHPLVFDPNTGFITRVKIDPQKYIIKHLDIYDLYDAPEGSEAKPKAALQPGDMHDEIEAYLDRQ